jgi:radical SAM superfamily enzyme YgiQ (UPF0313 family)
MKIKLLYLPRYPTRVTDVKNKQPSGVPFFPPVGISVLTSFLKTHNISVEQYDLMIKVHHYNLTNPPEKQINLSKFNDEKRLNKFVEKGNDEELENEGEKILKMTKIKGFDVFGFSLYDSFTPSTAGVALILAKLLKEKVDATIIIGGIIYEEIEEKLLRSGFIDYRGVNTFFSPAEINLLNFCITYEKYGKGDKVLGVKFIDRDKKIRSNEVRYNKQILIKPTFDGLPLELYKPKIYCEDKLGISTYNILVLPYFFIKGYPNKCAFCANSTLPYWAAKRPEEVAEDLYFLSKKYKTKYFFFLNPTINPTREYTEKVIAELKKKDVQILWTDCANFNGMDSELLRALKEIGAVRLVWGLESCSPRILKYIEKPFFTPEYAKEIMKNAFNLGIWNECDVICGFPYETEKDIQLTIDFIQENEMYIEKISLFKFWLDGKMKEFPEKYGIIVKEKAKRPKLSRPGLRLAFDEINGLTWKEKIKQIDKHYCKLQKVIDKIEKKPLSNKNVEEVILMHFIDWWGRWDKVYDKEKKYFPHRCFPIK